MQELKCEYCKNPIEFDDNFMYIGLGGLIKNQNGVIAWHSSCDHSENRENVSMSTKTKIKLCEHLFELKGKGRTDAWVDKVLHSCHDKKSNNIN